VGKRFALKEATVAENDSLDVKSPYGRRWLIAQHIAQQGGSSAAVGRAAKKAIHGAIKNSLRQLGGAGAGLGAFLKAKDSADECRKLLQKCKGHDYAQLLVDQMRANPGETDEQLLRRWICAAIDKVNDHLSHALVGSDHFPSFFETQKLFGEVEASLARDVQHISQHLAKDPARMPSRLPTKGADKVDPTQQMLSMSLLQGASQ
jgi:hypothetical protein